MKLKRYDHYNYAGLGVATMDVSEVGEWVKYADAKTEIERLTNNADNLRQQVEDLTEELRVERLNHGYLREEFDELHTGAVERLRQLQATIKERDALRQNAAMAQVCLDLHDALGVRFGDDPYAAIKALRSERA